MRPDRDHRARCCRAIPPACISGPNLAREVLAGYAAAAVVAMPDEHVAASLQALFASRVFRVYTSTDVLGCELGGVLKNVIAIAAGMAEGLGVGDNTRAMVITRGLAEITRLGVAMGGEPATFAGPDRPRRPDGDVHEPAEPQPAASASSSRAGARSRRSRPAMNMVAEGVQERPHGDRARPRRTASSCRSPRRSTRSSTRAAPPTRPSAACAGCRPRSELHAG